MAVASELGGGAVTMVALRFHFDERKSDREEESEGASECKWEAAGSLSLLTR